jgi:hypothetical protein
LIEGNKWLSNKYLNIDRKYLWKNMNRDNGDGITVSLRTLRTFTYFSKTSWNYCIWRCWQLSAAVLQFYPSVCVCFLLSENWWFYRKLSTIPIQQLKSSIIKWWIDKCYKFNNYAFTIISNDTNEYHYIKRSESMKIKCIRKYGLH